MLVIVSKSVYKRKKHGSEEWEYFHLHSELVELNDEADDEECELCEVNWMEVYRRVRETVYGWIYIIDPDMMARVRELQRLQEIEANEQEKEDEEDEEEERMQQREKGYPSESQGVMRESLANRRSSAGLAAASAYYNSISTPVGGKKGYMANKIVVDEEEDSESEEEEEEEEQNVGKNPTTGNNTFFSANPLHSNA